MAKSYTIKKNDDGSTTMTKTNDDGTKQTSTSMPGASEYDYKAGAFVSKDVADANNNTYQANGSSANYSYSPNGTAYVAGSGSNKSTGASSSASSRDSLINDYINAQKQAQVSALQNAYNNTINQIAQQEKATKDTATANRNNASVQSQLADQRVANFMANNGLTNSGTNAQMYMNSQGALQNSLGNITTAEQDALGRLGDQRVLAKQNLENDIASANAGLDATRLQYQLAQLEGDDEYKRQLELLAIQNGYDMDKLKYQTDVNNIYDDVLGRYVPFDTYMYTHPQIMANYQNTISPKVSGGGTGTVGLSGADIQKQYLTYLKDHDLTMSDLDINTFASLLMGENVVIPGEEEPDLGAYLNGDEGTTETTPQGKNILQKSMDGYKSIGKLAGNAIGKKIVQNPNAVNTIKGTANTVNTVKTVLDLLRK